MKKWKNDAMTELGWDLRTIASVAGNLRTPINKKGDFNELDAKKMVSVDDALITDSEASKSCTCNKNDDYCNGVIGGPNGPLRCTTTTSSCSSSSSGCGTLWLSSCNGLCF
ncbi:bacteriocin fulvocin C-related protein [Chitinophaga sp. 30R24]|uniref:bacteriocin fulvocin C-related protein n=1 Tax=Chitinophaga sp. 30R24 TaxID=3248838 RepID=UPI003B90859A